MIIKPVFVWSSRISRRAPCQVHPFADAVSALQTDSMTFKDTTSFFFFTENSEKYSLQKANITSLICLLNLI